MRRRLEMCSMGLLCALLLYACNLSPQAGYCKMRSGEESSAPLPPPGQLCALEEGVDASWDASCGQCGYRCLDGCANGTCTASLLVGAEARMRGPIDAGDSFIVSKYSQDGEPIVRVSPDGTESRLTTSEGHVLTLKYHDGWVYWLDSLRGGPDKVKRIHVRRPDGEETLATGPDARLLAITDRGLYILFGHTMAIVDDSGQRQDLTQLDPSSDSRVAAVLEDGDRLLVILSDLGLYELPREGGPLEQVLSPGDRRIYGVNRHENNLYISVSGREDTETEHHWGILKLDLSTSPQKYVTVVSWESEGVIPGIGAPTVYKGKLWWSTDRSIHYYPEDFQEPMVLPTEGGQVWEEVLRHAVHRHPGIRYTVFRDDAVYFSGKLEDCRGPSNFGLFRVPLPVDE